MTKRKQVLKYFRRPYFMFSFLHTVTNKFLCLICIFLFSHCSSITRPSFQQTRRHLSKAQQQEAKTAQFAKWKALMHKAHQIRHSNNLHLQDIRRLLGRLAVLLQGLPPAFSIQEIKALSSDFYFLGLPLEASLLIDFWAQTQPKRQKQKLISLRSLYLGIAGFFSQALEGIEGDKGFSKGIESNYDQKNFLITKLEWSLLAGDYDKAQAYTDELKDIGYNLSLLDKSTFLKKILTRLSLNRQLNSSINYTVLKSLIYHLGGKTQKASEIMEGMLTKLSKEEKNTKLYASIGLCLAQIYMQKQPKKAQQFAQDISYLAQDKGWIEIEYQATYLDGWANYVLEKYYRALIYFTKAGNIYPSSSHRLKPGYNAHLIGLLLSRMKLNPRQHSKRLLRTIESFIYTYDFDPSIAFLKHGIPLGLNRDFFIHEAVSHYNNQKRYNISLGILWRYYKSKEKQKHFKNLGGLLGMVNFLDWYNFLHKPSLIKMHHPSLPKLIKKIRAKREITSTLSVLSPKNIYLFPLSFHAKNQDQEQGLHLYLVYPNKTNKKAHRHSFTYIYLEAKQMKKIRKNCNYFSTEACQSIRADFSPFTKQIIKLSDTQSKSDWTRLLVFHNPTFSIPYETFLLGKGNELSTAKKTRKTLETFYFYSLQDINKVNWFSNQQPYPIRTCSDLADFSYQYLGLLPQFLLPQVWYKNSSPSKTGIWDRRLNTQNFSCHQKKLKSAKLTAFVDKKKKDVKLIMYSSKSKNTFSVSFIDSLMQRGISILEIDENRIVSDDQKQNQMGNNEEAILSFLTFMRQGLSMTTAFHRVRQKYPKYSSDWRLLVNN